MRIAKGSRGGTVKGRRRIYGRTLDRDRGLGENHPKTLMLVRRFNAVSVRAVGVGIRSRWALGRRLGAWEETVVQGCLVADGTVPVVRELANLQLDVVDSGVDRGAPILECLGGRLQFDDAVAVKTLSFLEMLLPLEVALGEALVDLIGEEFLDLTEQDLGVWVHDARMFLETGEVVVGREGLQVRISDTRMLETGLREGIRREVDEGEEDDEFN